MGPFDRFNDRAKRVLALAQDEAIRFNHNYIGVEHLLLGLVREGQSVGAGVIESLGVSLEQIRHRVIELLAKQGTDISTAATAGVAPTTGARVIGSSHMIAAVDRLDAGSQRSLARAYWEAGR